MTLRVHTNNGIISISTRADVKVDDILEQIDRGNSILIETIYGTTFILNCMNVNAIEISSIDIPPYSK